MKLGEVVVVLQFCQVSSKSDEKQKSFINCLFSSPEFQSVSRIVKIVHSADTWILRWRVNTVPSHLQSEFRRGFFFFSQVNDPFVLGLFFSKGLKMTVDHPRRGREVDPCLNEAISQNHHLYSSSSAFSSKIQIWKQCVFEYTKFWLLVASSEIGASELNMEFSIIG